MNRFFTKSLVLVALVGAITAFAPSKAQADFLTGTVDYTGAYTADDEDLTQASQLAISNVVVVDSSGDFLTTFGIDFLDLLNHIATLAFDPVGTPYLPLWTHAASGVTFDLTTLNIEQREDNFLDLSGDVVFHAAGFDDTPGVWNLSLQQVNGQVSGSFSSSSIVEVPEPVSMSLLGLGLAALAARRRKQA